MTNILINLYLTNAVLCALFGIHLLLTVPPSPISTRLLGMNYLLYALQSSLTVIVLAFVYPPAQILKATFAMAIGPAFYLYYLSVLKSGSVIHLAKLCHFLPAILVSGIMISKSSYTISIDFLIISSLILYLSFAVFTLFRRSQLLELLVSDSKAAYRWLCILAGLIFINLLIEILVLWDINRGIPVRESKFILFGAILFLLFNSATILLGLKRSPFFEWMYKKLKIKLSREEAENIFHIFKARVLNETLYKQESGLSIKAIARQMGISQRHLSEAINRVYKNSFSQFLNDLRVNEAMDLIKKNPGIRITELMFSSGFSTKSNFNKEFQRVTKMSPTEYRKQF